MTSPAVTSAPRTPSVITPTFSQKDIYTALMAKSLDVPDPTGTGNAATTTPTRSKASPSAFEYPPPPPPSPVESRSPNAF
ncbi:hypothetical protein BDV11DRAFT_191766 [Aspergillus similis]